MNEELQKQANKKSVSVEQKQELLDVELKDVSGGKIHIDETRVDFTFRYRYYYSGYQIREIIKSELRKRGVPESVVSTVPAMRPEKSCMWPGFGEMRVVWEQGWPHPIYYRNND